MANSIQQQQAQADAARAQQVSDAARATWLADQIIAAQDTGDAIPVLEHDWEIIIASLRLYATVYRAGSMQ